MSVFAILLLLQSAASPPAAQGAQGGAPGTAPPAAEHMQESEPASRGLWAPSGKRDGRRGNDLYRQGAYADAAAAYAGGIAILPDDAGPRLRYGLRNNLGAALLQSGDAESARRAFDQAMAEAGGAAEASDAARLAYNAGNAAFAAQDFERALAYYRRSLLQNPDNADARFNYEFVKRRIEKQEMQEGESGEGEEQEGESGESSDDENGGDGQNEAGQDENEPQSRQDEQNERQGESAQAQEQEGRPQDEQGEQGEERRLSQAQAERILQALEQEEGNLLRELQRAESRPHQVEKDW